MSNESKIFPLVLHKSYYDKGFFNVRVEFDNLVRATEGEVLLVLGDERLRVPAKVRRSAGTAQLVLTGTLRCVTGSIDGASQDDRICGSVGARSNRHHDPSSTVGLTLLATKAPQVSHADPARPCRLQGGPGARSPAFIQTDRVRGLQTKRRAVRDPSGADRSVHQLPATATLRRWPANVLPIAGIRPNSWQSRNRPLFLYLGLVRRAA